MTFNLVEFVARLRKTMGRIRAASTLVTIATDEYKSRGFAEMISTVFDVEIEKGEDIQFLHKGELFIFDALQVLSYDKLVLSCRSLDNHKRCLRLNRECAYKQVSMRHLHTCTFYTHSSSVFSKTEFSVFLQRPQVYQ